MRCPVEHISSRTCVVSGNGCSEQQDLTTKLRAQQTNLVVAGRFWRVSQFRILPCVCWRRGLPTQSQQRAHGRRPCAFDNSGPSCLLACLPVANRLTRYHVRTLALARTKRDGHQLHQHDGHFEFRGVVCILIHSALQCLRVEVPPVDSRKMTPRTEPQFSI